MSSISLGLLKDEYYEKKNVSPQPVARTADPFRPLKIFKC